MSEKFDIGSANKILFYESQLKDLYEIGMALSSEKDTFKFLDLFISNSINLTASDAGTVYLVVEALSGDLSFIKGHDYNGKLLKFAFAKNQSMQVKLEESLSEITLGSICGYTAVTGLPLNIEDAYAIPSEAEYSHNKQYDLTTGYLTKSVLSVPMKTHEDKLLGVIQLINKKKPGVAKIDYHQKDAVNQIIPFEDGDELLMISLAGQAAVALENNLLYREMENLLQSYKKQNEQLEILSRNILKAHEEERKRIAREIHDGPAQSVANLSLKLEIAKKYLQKGDSEQAVANMNELNESIRSSVKEIRTLIYDLKPSYLDDGLLKALTNHFNVFSANTGIAIEFNTAVDELKLEYYLTSTIYRIVQEALTNIHKHARAKQVEITLNCEAEQLLLVIADDGVGFDPSARKGRNKTEGGFGLEGMRERAELIKGIMDIESKPGAGTKIRLEIPLAK